MTYIYIYEKLGNNERITPKPIDINYLNEMLKKKKKVSLTSILLLFFFY